METLKNDLRFATVLLSINMVVQLLNNSTYDLFLQVTVIALSCIMFGVTCLSMLRKEDRHVQYGLLVYIITYLTAIVTLGCFNVINIIDVMYSIIWAITILAYIISLSHPNMGILTIALSLVSTFILQAVTESNVAESFNSIYGLLIITLIALAINVYIIQKHSDTKLKLRSMVLYERKPLKIKLWVQIVIWSIIVTTVSYIARTQFYEVMNAEMKYVIMASASVLITTFLTIGALTTSVFIVEIFGMYVALELYTISYLVFIPNSNWGMELATIIIDIAILGYLISKYKKQIKEHDVQKEVKD